MNARRGGFTLVEMLVVMVILAILAASVAVVLIRIGDRARMEKAQSQIRLIATALDVYRRDIGGLPPDTGYGLDMESGSGTYDAGSLWRYLTQRLRDPKTGELAGPFLEWPQEDLTAYADASAGRSFYLADPWRRPYAFVGERKRVIHNPGSFDVFSSGSTTGMEWWMTPASSAPPPATAPARTTSATGPRAESAPSGRRRRGSRGPTHAAPGTPQAESRPRRTPGDPRRMTTG
ncbi:MAG: prepilin-type N-terminal cleavage/methylation domain-containing protein [Planctomycetota bacterium]|jgi:prepilin-type N-terminal cleavage/methylation domain-containing protein